MYMYVQADESDVVAKPRKQPKPLNHQEIYRCGDDLVLYMYSTW